MVVDLLKVQQAANEAHRSFVETFDLDLDVHRAILVSYIDEFLHEPVERPAKVRSSAQGIRAQLPRFRSSVVDVKLDVASLLIERNLLVLGGSTYAMEVMFEGLQDYLDKANRVIARKETAENLSNSEVYDEGKVENIKAKAVKLGYAVALVEQLAANLAINHYNSLNEFCHKYLKETTTIEAVKDVDSKDVVEILADFLGGIFDDITLLGLIKKIFSVVDKKRERKAGVKPGDTDIMFELDEILTQSAEGMDAIKAALRQAKIEADALRSRAAAVSAAAAGQP